MYIFDCLKYKVVLNCLYKIAKYLISYNLNLNFCYRNALEIALSKSRSQCEIEAISGNESINEKKNRKTNLRRSHTHSEAVMPRNIAEIRAKLQQNGENEWKKRIAQNNNATNELKLLTEKIVTM